MSVNYWLGVCNFLIIFSYSLGRPNQLKNDTSVIIHIQDGRIRGSKLESMGNKFYSFQEIPYAVPPVGPLRFKEPQPASKWKGVLNTTENTKICVDFGLSLSSDSRQNEDCLYLNVYTPVDPRNKVSNFLPVLFWIHGGSFLSGSGTYDDFGPGFFMGYNIILVAINYRLGPFGFLSTGDDVIPGNFGLKDQHLALQWVQNNIKYFGGDPEKVTVMGQSAGAASVGYHLLSEKSKGLFRAAIMESGSPLNCWSLQKHPKEAAYILGRALDRNISPNNSSEELLKLLQNTPVEKFRSLSSLLMVLQNHQNCYNFFFLIWTPVIEANNSQNPLVTGLTHENIKNGKAKRVPLLMGINSQEVLLFDLTLIRSDDILFDVNAANIITKNINMATDNKKPAGTEIRNIYTNGSFSLNFAASCRFASDSLFTTPVARHGYLQSQYNDVYFYQMSYKGKLGEQSCSQTVEGAEGVCHGEELEYLFVHRDNQDLSKYPETDLTVQKRMLQLWTGFVKTLNPTSEKLDILQNITWPKVTTEQFNYLDINETLTLKKNPKEYNKFQKTFDKYANKLLDSY